MRVGHNPNYKRRADLQLQRLMLGCITHLPNMEGYHAERFEVVKTCLETMRAGAHLPHTFAVWDNGSCPEFREWLQKVFVPDVLILSPNIGKTAARTALARMGHPAGIFAYSDDDMLFMDDWLRPQIEILEHFPNVASVTGYPVRTAFRWGVENTLHWARTHAKLEAGQFLPRKWEDDFARSLGRDPDWHTKYTAEDVDYRVTYNGKQAYCTSHHCQFIGKVGQLEKILQYDVWSMGDERPFDLALDSIGLRLATTQRLARHIGNVIDDSIRSELWHQQELPH